MIKYFNCVKLALATVVVFILMTTLCDIAENTFEQIIVDINQVNVDVNSKKVNGNNLLYNETTYVPLREIAEMFAKKVVWNVETNTAYIVNDALSESATEIAPVVKGSTSNLKCDIKVMVNQINVVVSGVKVEGDNILYNDTTYVPLRKIAEMLDKDVVWTGTNNQVSIIDKKL